jgi:hypothetical protein
VAAHTPGPGRPPAGRLPGQIALLAVVDDLADTGRALASGADLIDATGMASRTVAAIRAHHPGVRLWTGSPAAVDADEIAAAACAGDTPLAAVVAAAAISTWLGRPVIRTRHIRSVRRAIDMTRSIAGTRPPALTIRGLA